MTCQVKKYIDKFNSIDWNAFAKCGEPIENIYQFNGIFVNDTN